MRRYSVTVISSQFLFYFVTIAAGPEPAIVELLLVQEATREYATFIRASTQEMLSSIPELMRMTRSIQERHPGSRFGLASFSTSASKPTGSGGGCYRLVAPLSQNEKDLVGAMRNLPLTLTVDHRRSSLSAIFTGVTDPFAGWSSAPRDPHGKRIVKVIAIITNAPPDRLSTSLTAGQFSTSFRCTSPCSFVRPCVPSTTELHAALSDACAAVLVLTPNIYTAAWNRFIQSVGGYGKVRGLEILSPSQLSGSLLMGIEEIASSSSTCVKDERKSALHPRPRNHPPEFIWSHPSPGLKISHKAPGQIRSKSPSQLPEHRYRFPEQSTKVEPSFLVPETLDSSFEPAPIWALAVGGAELAIGAFGIIGILILKLSAKDVLSVQTSAMEPKESFREMEPVEEDTDPESIVHIPSE